MNIYYIWRHQFLKSIIISAITLGFVFNIQLVPGIQQYSEGRRFAELIRMNHIQPDQIYFFNRDSRAMEFYLQKRIRQVTWEELLDMQRENIEARYYMSLDGKEALQDAGLNIEDEMSMVMYDLNRITLGFLNPRTRKENLEERYLIKFR